MPYHHKQTGKLHLILLATSLILLFQAWPSRAMPVLMVVPLGIIMGGCALGLVLLAFCFHSLVIRDESKCLVLQYGPIPVFSKRFRYSEITAVEPSRSIVLDGWGIHYCPGRGWTYNLWGFDCVKVQIGQKTVRIGTDDVDGLVAFLKGKIDLVGRAKSK